MSFFRFVKGASDRALKIKDDERQFQLAKNLEENKLKIADKISKLGSVNQTIIDGPNGQQVVIETSSDKSKQPKAFAMEVFSQLPTVLTNAGIEGDASWLLNHPIIQYAGSVASESQAGRSEPSEGGIVQTQFGLGSFIPNDPRLEGVRSSFENTYFTKNQPQNLMAVKGYVAGPNHNNTDLSGTEVGDETFVSKAEPKYALSGIALDKVTQSFKLDPTLSGPNIKKFNTLFFNTNNDETKLNYSLEDIPEFVSIVEQAYNSEWIKTDTGQYRNSNYKEESETELTKVRDNSLANQNVDQFADEIEKIIYGYTTSDGKVFQGIRATGGVVDLGLLLNAFTDPVEGVIPQLKGVWNSMTSMNDDYLESTQKNTMLEDGTYFLEKKARQLGVRKEDAMNSDEFKFTDKTYTYNGVTMKVSTALADKDKQVGEKGSNGEIITEAYRLQAIQIGLAFQMAIALQGYQGGKAVSDADFDRAWQAITGARKNSFWGNFTSLQADRATLFAARQQIVTNEIGNQGYIYASRGKRGKMKSLMLEMYKRRASELGVAVSKLGVDTLFANKNFTINYDSIPTDFDFNNNVKTTFDPGF